MASYPGHHGGQQHDNNMDDTLEELWSSSTRGIQEIDPGTIIMIICLVFGCNVCDTDAMASFVFVVAALV